MMFNLNAGLATAGRHLVTLASLAGTLMQKKRPNTAPVSSGLRTIAVAASLLAMTLSASVAFAATGFYVSGRSLKDANGNNFYPRGVNNPHIWFDSQAYNVLSNLAARRTNCIRIVWGRGGSASRLDQILQRCKDLKMVPMVEIHDGTGSDNANELILNAQYYARTDVANVLKKHQRYVLINITNEWGSYYKSAYDWKEAYKQPINIIRNAGIVTTLVIDGPNWGQAYSPGVQYGQELLNYDRNHNLLFSVHMYGSYNGSTSVNDAMRAYYNANLPLVIGEFGYDYNSGNNNLGCRVDHRKVMQYANQYGYGYIAWSTQGNDSSNAWLDMMTNWSGTSWWGNEIYYNNTYSIYNTARASTAF